MTLSFLKLFPENAQAILASLALPPLTGKKFLNIACGNGYFCGYAFFDAAARIIGIDEDNKALIQARSLFPACAFHRGDWEELPDLFPASINFDIILCASARALVTPTIVSCLMSRLADGGTLIFQTAYFENGAPIGFSEVFPGWFNIEQQNAQNLVPNWGALEAMLAPFAWKFMGISESCSINGLKRGVFHIQRLMPCALLLMGTPGSGKSTLARRMFGGKNLITGDALLVEAANCAYPALKAHADQIVSFQRLDIVIRKLFEDSSWREYAAFLVEKAEGKDFIFDGYIPRENQDRFAQAIAQAGFRVIRVETPAPGMQPAELSIRGRKEARKYHLFLEAYATLAKKAHHS